MGESEPKVKEPWPWANQMALLLCVVKLGWVVALETLQNTAEADAWVARGMKKEKEAATLERIARLIAEARRIAEEGPLPVYPIDHVRQ